MCVCVCVCVCVCDSHSPVNCRAVYGQKAACGFWGECGAGQGAAEGTFWVMGLLNLFIEVMDP